MQKRRVGMYWKNKGFCHKLKEMASRLCPNIKHVILHCPMELTNQNEDSAYLLVQVVQAVSGSTHWLEKSWLVCFSNFHNRNTCIKQTEGVLLPVAIVLHGAYRKCSTYTVRRYDRHFWCMYLPLLSNGLETYDSHFSCSANNFFLFLDASKKTGGSPGLPLRAAGCGIHYRQISPYHHLCLVGNTLTATRPADL